MAVLTAARRLIDQVHVANIAERWWGRTFDLPGGVGIRIVTMGNNPEQVRSLKITGDFRVETLRAEASSEAYIAQADVWDLTFLSIDPESPERGARVDTFEPGGATTSFVITPDVRTSTPSSATYAPTQRSEVQNVSNTSSTGGALVGEIVPCDPFDVTEMTVPRVVAELATVRSGVHDLENLLFLRPQDGATAMFGTPPNYLPVVGTMTDGAMLGLTVDAEELGVIDPKLLLYEPRMDGAVPADESMVLRTVLDRSINSRWADGEAPPAATALADELGIEFRAGVRDLEFSWKVKRRRPSIAPTGWKWRHDSSGNAVLAPKEAWGTVSISRPQSVTRAMAMATDLAESAPGAALYCAQEAMVLANKAHDGTAISSAYAAMVGPLIALGRPRIAVRAAALAVI